MQILSFLFWSALCYGLRMTWSSQNMLISSSVSQTCQFMDAVEGNLNDK